ncbi:hypothetical protein [Methylocystis suflitae]|uniref:hypothetical protein n=1 Tax=Methylocystis suflitae TaxID=2951405 RepID=UPI002108BDB5|nr:hypothetical protein [Methylocystis suflitae]MCQ4188805.1 hypothetical protein [Methylocystis suflitae]
MWKYLVLTLLGLSVAAGAAQSKDHAKAPQAKAPQARAPTILRMPGGAQTQPDGPIPYSVWYYVLYQPFCEGKSAKTCVWACGEAPAQAGRAE